MVYEKTFLRNFRFYAKTLTKLHDLTVSFQVSSLYSYVGIRTETLSICNTQLPRPQPFFFLPKLEPSVLLKKEKHIRFQKMITMYRKRL
jgi:hypothetical protein